MSDSDTETLLFVGGYANGQRKQVNRRCNRFGFPVMMDGRPEVRKGRVTPRFVSCYYRRRRRSDGFTFYAWEQSSAHA